MTTRKITFARLTDGSWGIRGPLNGLTLGETVVVTKCGGAEKRVTVGELVSSDPGAWNQDAPKGASYYRIAGKSTASKRYRRPPASLVRRTYY